MGGNHPFGKRGSNRCVISSHFYNQLSNKSKPTLLIVIQLSLPLSGNVHSVFDLLLCRHGIGPIIKATAFRGWIILDILGGDIHHGRDTWGEPIICVVRPAVLVKLSKLTTLFQNSKGHFKNHWTNRVGLIVFIWMYLKCWNHYVNNLFLFCFVLFCFVSLCLLLLLFFI